MHSELHERLEYLVNYSSQLIFVSSDSIAQQKKTLEAFVFQQSDDTEIAFITADENMETGDYRRQLCRQLLGQMVGSYIRPLNELLASLNQHDGPILITITQAQFIPDKLLQELWDLVLQSRFAANKQHLNVLLFGESEWAERAKQWLPAKNSDTPLLISNQSVAAKQTDSSLDKMITQRREAFHAHLAKRYGAPATVSANRMNSPWLWAAITVLFIAIFSALMGWLYRDSLSSLFEPLATTATVDEVPAVTPGSAFQELAPAEIPASPTPKNSGASTQQLSSDSSKSELVTDWQEAINGLGSFNAKKTSASDDNLDVAQTSETEDASSRPDQVDIPAVEAEPVPEPATTVNNDTTYAGDPDPAPGTVESTPPAIQELSFANDKLREQLRSDDFLIQLAGLKDGELLARFIDDYNLHQLVNVYRTQRYGGDWYVMLFHQPFSSLQSARQAMAQLPDFPGKNDAFVKRGSQILGELEEVQ